MSIVTAPAASDLARQVSQSLDGQALWDLTASITGTYRMTGSAEELATFKQIQQMLDQAGLKTRLFSHPAYVSLPVKGRIRVDGREFPAITHSFAAPVPAAGRPPMLLGGSYSMT